MSRMHPVFIGRHYGQVQLSIGSQHLIMSGEDAKTFGETLIKYHVEQPDSSSDNLIPMNDDMCEKLNLESLSDLAAKP